jgi:hypothetical protein
MLWKAGGLATGMAVSSLFVVNMNDVIYYQLRRNFVQPARRLFGRASGD